MGIFKKSKNGGFMDQIRCDETSYLIWKWHPNGAEPGNNGRENAIRWGSSLRVKDGEVAVFVYKQKDGTVEDFIVGPFDEKIKTSNLPILAPIIGLAYDGGTPFQAEIYFINLAEIIQIKFGVPYFDVYDPRFDDFGVPVAIRGTVSFQIQDYKQFIKLHRLITFNLDQFKEQVKDAIAKYAKDVVANAPAKHNIPLVQIETKLSLINDVVEEAVVERFKNTFGILVSGVDISSVEVDKESPAYKSLISVTKEVTSEKIKAETQDYIEKLRIQREEGQYAQHKQTQSTNIGAYKVEKQTEVGIAGAEALGKMGENNVGQINVGDGDGGGSGGTGFNPVSMMAGMAVAGTVGKNISETLNGVLGSNNSQANSGVTPPPIPSDNYYVAVNDQAIGPFDKNALKQMAITSQINADSLVWKNGMSEWVAIKNLDELKEIFNTSTPPIPNNKDN